MKIVVSFNLLLFPLFILSCNNPPDSSSNRHKVNSEDAIGYNLSDPDKIIILPDILYEVSGISVIDSSSVACIQDENGIIFIYDVRREEITNRIFFHSDGDFEGIASVKNTLYILRSDGVLFEVFNYGSPGFKKKSFPTGIPAYESEGLCYDMKSNRLLVAPKSNIGKGREYENTRVIYYFNLNNQKLIKEPAFNFDLKLMKKFASEKLFNIPEQVKKKKKTGEPDIKFRISAIGIHPVTNKLFVLSGVEKLLFIFNMNGTLEHIEKLDPVLFIMPEGIAFFQNGDMLISNEGMNKKPTLLRFNYIPN